MLKCAAHKMRWQDTGHTATAPGNSLNIPRTGSIAHLRTFGNSRASICLTANLNGDAAVFTLLLRTGTLVIF